ncbi:MAG: TRAP transporter substrate-binding protein DctP [Spirochaetales bacterium]|nr:TRAP transporter substrate-binding protein DctP [Spirochaetales bacterium]
MKNKFLLFSILLLSAAVFQVNAITLKLASLLPSGTEWDRSLNSMANDWKEVTDGRVQIKIYPGGIAGGEADVIRKMRIGQIDMAVLTSTGMMSIVPDSFVMNLPFMLESEDELDFIVENVTPMFDEAFKEKGFIVLTWSKTGWVNFFTRDKVITPEDMKKTKFSGPVTQPELTSCFKKMGMNVIPVDLPDLLMSLQSGMVDSIYTAPMAAASYQWFAITDNMLDMRVSPVLGGIVITEKAWRRIPDKYKEELFAAARSMSKDFYSEAERLEAKAIDVMVDNGLTINEPEADTQEKWQKLLGVDYSVLVGDDNIVSKEIYNEVSTMLKEYRSK